MELKEIWKDIEGYEGCYEISSLGRVKSLDRVVYNGKGLFLRKGKEKVLQTDKDGYKTIMLSYKGVSKLKKVHRLVSAAFLLNPENKPTVNHINSIRSDNRVVNLEWNTIKENVNHSFKKGNRTNKRKND